LSISELFAGIAVTDLGTMESWYERLVGRPADMHPNENEAVWRLSERGWIYLVGDPGRAGRGLLTILVDDLDDQIAELAERGLRAGAVDTIPGAVRKSELTDPEGNRVTFGEALGDSG
jgi:hypothetical protein